MDLDRSDPSGGELSDVAVEEYGGGEELPTLSFLILGLVTFWIYTVWKYHDLLQDHFRVRREFFEEQVDAGGLAADQRAAYDDLIKRGFTGGTHVRNVALALYATSVVLLASEFVAEGLFLSGRIGYGAFRIWAYSAVGPAALCFCAASIAFMSWVVRITRDHEYHELLLARFVSDPAGFKVVRRSSKFRRRWNRNRSSMALFLVLSVPMTISPILAVRQVDLNVGSSVSLTTMWLVALFVFAGVFHLWGTRLLLTMYNGHLRIEELNRQVLDGGVRWIPATAPAVLDERPGGEEDHGPGELLPRRLLAAIMITDMVGFSREMEESEERTFSKLLEHNAIVRAAISRNSGDEVKTIGDAFLVRFASAVDAVHAAIDIQRQMSVYNQGRDSGASILVRIGIHTGDVLAMDGDVLGNGVNLAARIEPLAEPGGICISDDTYKLVRVVIDLDVESLGTHKLKNIEHAPELFQISHESILGASPGLRGRDAH